MSKGNLIHVSYSDLTSAIELLDRLGVSYDHLTALKKASSWQQQVVAAVLAGDTYLLKLLELEVAAKKAGFSAGDIASLVGKEDLLHGFRQVILGQAEIKPLDHLINLDADPFLPSGWSAEEHKKGGKWKFDSTQIQLYFSKKQQGGKVITGEKLREELAKKPVLNANILDYLLAHPQLIPEEWKGKVIFFWGTIYRDSLGHLCVRCLYWLGDSWSWDARWLGLAWDACSPAALRAS